MEREAEESTEKGVIGSVNDGGVDGSCDGVEKEEVDKMKQCRQCSNKQPASTSVDCSEGHTVCAQCFLDVVYLFCYFWD